jgi:glycosyltransferase involved in cell wall biosynthesis
MIKTALPASVDLPNLPRPGNDRPRSIAVLGDVMDPHCFGGAPRLFFEEAHRQGFAQHGWSVDVRKLRRGRLIWNAAQCLRGRRPGGFQFSSAGKAAALAQIPADLWATEIISFHQHFPSPDPIIRAGGELNFYLDATYTQLFPSYGLDRSLDPRMLRDAIDQERSAFSAARRVIVSQSWAHRSLLSDYGLDHRKCAVILPAANYPVFPGLGPLMPEGRAGRDRPFVLGFIGKDWKRKGLMFLNQVAAELRTRGWKVAVRAIGFPGDELPAGSGIESLGFIDKRTQLGPFLHSCDVGCLFSSAEAAGIAMLEFLGVGLPVAGFTVNGLADLLPSEAGFRFAAGTSSGEVADIFHGYLQDESQQARFRAAAQRLAPSLRWERCLREFREFWETGTLSRPFRLYPNSSVESSQP